MNLNVCFSYKTAHAASDDFSFHIQHCHKMRSQARATRQGFSIESTTFALILRDALAIATICNFYIRIT